MCIRDSIYVLKNRSNSVNIDNQNRLHPFYMVYISKDGEVICDHLSPKQMLDKMRFLCKGKTEPIPELYRQFNKETRDGRNMSEFSRPVSYTHLDVYKRQQLRFFVLLLC